MRGKVERIECGGSKRRWWRWRRGGRSVVYVFFFKQKTAYEIYQCDWSSDVCSSDLAKDFELLKLWHCIPFNKKGSVRIGGDLL